MTKSVLWDLDGTLVDSEQYHWFAWRDTMSLKASRSPTRNSSRPSACATTPSSRNGFPASRQSASIKLPALRSSSIAAWSATAPSIPCPASPLDRTTRPRRLAASHRILRPARKCPRRTRRHRPRPCFQAIVCAEDVTLGKPDPQVFLTAAARLGPSPAHSIVVEDAPAGIEAARRAGMASIGVRRNGSPLPADSPFLPSPTSLPTPSHAW